MFAQKDAERQTSLTSKGTILKLGIFIGLALVLVFCLSKTTQIEPMQVFDPYELLEIEKEATEKEIKKAFKRQSLKWHPDKNRDNPLIA